jgi:DNA processing protein
MLRYYSISLKNICSNDTMTGVSRQALGDCIFLPAPPFKERRFIPGHCMPGLSRSAFCKELAQAGLAQKAIENLTKLRTTSTPQQELEKLERLRIRVITWKDKAYPPLLREIDDSPPVLYTYGKLTEVDQFALAVVGTRSSTTYGRQVTERLVGDLVKGQVTIVSGLALGIDTIAHTAALDGGGRTIAVLACGLDIIYPSTNRGLARRMVESGQGVLVTEYPLGVQPEGGNFPARNRTVR